MLAANTAWLSVPVCHWVRHIQFAQGFVWACIFVHIGPGNSFPCCHFETFLLTPPYGVSQMYNPCNLQVKKYVSFVKFDIFKSVQAAGRRVLSAHRSTVRP